VTDTAPTRWRADFTGGQCFYRRRGNILRANGVYSLQIAQQAQESAMKKFSMIAISLADFTSSSAFAQGKTRAEVNQEMIEPLQKSLNEITEISYPGVNPMFTAQVARRRQQLAHQDAATTNSATN
jgi:hypothetical protein